MGAAVRVVVDAAVPVAEVHEYLVADVALDGSARGSCRGCRPLPSRPGLFIVTVRETDPGKGDGGIVTDTGTKPLISWTDWFIIRSRPDGLASHGRFSNWIQ